MSYNYTYIPELRVTTAEFDCTHLFVIFSPLHDGLYVTVQPCSTVAHTHSIRQSVCFVTILVSFVRAIKRVSCSFYSNHSILCTHIYLYSIHICIFVPLFFHFDIFLFFFFCLGLLFGLKGRVKTEAPNVSDSEWNTKRTWSNSHATTRPTVKVLIFRNFQSSL